MIDPSQTPIKELSKDQIDSLDDFVCDLKATPCRNYAERLLRMFNYFKREKYDLSKYQQVYEFAQELVK
tara:strand:+ start:318 stop:524 length:207 start_codon:yes stop_codon:yes gene_type:complete